VSQTALKSFATARPVAILVVFIAAGVFGLLSYFQLPVTLMPELTYPTLTVRTTYPGAAPEEVENDIGRPIEDALGVVGGIQKISSINRAGISDVVLEFTWDTEMSDATQEVLEKLDRVFLPMEAERPLILHYDPSLDPILELSLSGDGERFHGQEGLRRLRRLAELQVKRQIEPIKGIAAVRVRGGLEEEIHVKVDAASLRRTGIPIQRVIDRLAQENINVAGGTLQEGRIEYLVRTLNEFQDLDQIRGTIVSSFEGRPIRIRDLATVSWEHKEREILTRTDGGDSVQIDIFKEADANIVGVAKSVNVMIGTIVEGDDENRGAGVAQTLFDEEGARLSLAADRSLFIESSIDEVKQTAVLGGFLAISILYLFLRNFKSTAIIFVSIPLSLLVAFAPLKMLGVSLNIMSLGGLALGIGMLVDSSIVVLESIFRCRQEGDGILQAAVRGTLEVRAAVWASTFTSIAVFFPMVFVEGLAGQAFGDLGFAVVFSLLASALVALYFIPMLASLQLNLRGGTGDESPEGLKSLLRWSSWHGFRRDLGAPSRVTRSLLTLPLRGKSLLGKVGLWLFYPLWIVCAVLTFVVGYFFVFIGRLVLGTILEFLGKLLAAVVFGVGWLIARYVVPVVVVAFRVVTWLPRKIVGGILDTMNRIYPPLLRGALAAPLLIVVLVFGVLWVTWQVGTSLDSELLPEVHQGEFTVEVQLPVGTPLSETESIVIPVEQALLKEKENIQSLLLTVGYDSANSQRSDEGEHTAAFKVLLDEKSRSAEAEQAVIDRLRTRFSRIPDLDARVVRPVLFSSKTPIEVEIYGNNLRLLRDYSTQVKEVLARLPELTDVETTLRPGAPEVQIVYDRDRLSLYDLSIGDVARHVRDKVKGFEATRFNMTDRRIPILVRLQMDDRETVEDVRDLIVNPGGDRPIPLSAVADVSLGEGPSEVRRVDGSRVGLVQANLGEGSLSAAATAIETALHAELDWPAELGFAISGQNEEWQRSQRSLLLALALSMFLVYVIMAIQFESLVHPLVIMLTIPLAFVGTVLALKILGLNLSIVVFLGMIMLAGIVVNNAIVFVDYINKLRERGMERAEAIVTAGQVRLRPILMTTMTTVLGLLPLALGVGDGAEIRAPMAIAVISGLITSTALTLLVIPVVYSLFDSVVAWMFRSRVKKSEQDAPLVAGGSVDSVAP